jgi:sugar-specific transcriptional regulator TrmB
MIQQLFDSLGISHNEALVYTALAEVGKASPASLAKTTRIPRSSVYTALDALLKRGLVAVEKSQDTSLYLINRPEALIRMVESEREEFAKLSKEKELAAQELIPLLTPYFQNRNYNIPKLQFFEGTANVRSMLYEYTPEWQASVAKYDYTWWGYQDHYFVQEYSGWLAEYWESMHAEEKIQLLSNRSDIERKLKNKVRGRTIKAAPKRCEFSSTIWILGDYVVTIMTRQQPHYAVMLKDSVFAANQRMLFRMLWDEIR